MLIIHRRKNYKLSKGSKAANDNKIYMKFLCIFILTGVGFFAQSCAKNKNVNALIDMRNGVQIKNGSPILLNGIKIGTVEDISSSKNVYIFIGKLSYKHDYCIPKSAVFELVKSGVISDEYHVAVHYKISSDCIDDRDTVTIRQAHIVKTHRADSATVKLIDSTASIIKGLIEKESGK